MSWKIFFGVCLGLVFAGVSYGADTGRVVSLDARFLFVPQGFDSNDQTEVVVDGFLPDACYKIVPPRVEFNMEQKLFTIVPQAFHFEGEGMVCGTYQVPYTVTANLGVVRAGSYALIARGVPEKKLQVNRSSSIGPDDFLYAPVDQVFVDIDASRQSIVAYITGRYTNSCMRLTETKILEQGETTVLLPIISLENRDDCHETDMSYKGISVKLPWKGPGRYLVHTRSLSGSSVNSVFSIDGE
ncbi:MAG: hypothetical protein NTV34_10570 [Proteobacteria bacterium]|nr:hypothetical protein [Pseudomonadota bacterium]